MKVVRKVEADKKQEWMYDLANDIGEEVDLAASNPLDFARLQRLVGEWENRVKADR